MKYVVGVDVGATKIRVGLFTLSGELLRATTTSTPQEGSDTVVAGLIVSKIFELTPDPRRDVVAVGVGTVGPIDIRRGDVVGAPNVKLRNFKLKAPIEEALRVRTYVVNDCVAAAWGEYTVGAGRGLSNVVYVTLSTGIGCGAVIEDHLLLGKDGNAHEVGHIVLDYSGRFTCGCGGLGHWEGIASGANIPKTAAVL
ncbi:MAG: ROK family protein, partial [Sulfolobales archaeon]|nr:ROK family protein [Sulfolobales archaeon]MDW8011351.1 ROK family protein [Sulfolobales archaeon]